MVLKDLLKEIKDLKKSSKLNSHQQSKLDGIKLAMEAMQGYLGALDKELPWGVIISHGYSNSKEFVKIAEVFAAIREELELK